MDIKEQIKNLPEEPGVYLFYNKDGLVVYVGKSKCIRKRVQNYFTSSGDSRAFVQNLPQELGRIHFIVTYTEKEALLLENSLIRKHKPNYNIRFKDDSSYISLKLEISNTFPRLTLVKKVNNKSSLYFGPYTSQGALKNTLQVIKKAFPLRTCTDSEFKRRTRPCMVYQIHRCQAPCVGRQTQKEYQETVSRLILFLKGKDKTLCENLKKQMEKESSELNFEKAIRLRNQLFALQKTTEKQIVLSHKDQNQDVFVCEKKQDSAIIQAMHIRSGKVISTKSTLSMDLHSSSEILSAYLKHYYCKEVFLPDEILLGEKIEDQEVLSILVSEKKRQKSSHPSSQKGREKEND